MAEEKLNFVMEDLQKHLLSANVEVANLSNIAKNGDEKLVEKFISETIFVNNPAENRRALAEKNSQVLQSQLYIACFWGFRDVVKGLLSLSQEQGIDLDVNCQNKETLWTPLHAATFQEHGPVLMHLLQKGADPELPDSENRSPKDFASASDKVWSHFQALGLRRTPRPVLVQMGILKQLDSGLDAGARSSPRANNIPMADYSRPEYSGAAEDPFANAARGGDVLANDDTEVQKQTQPQFKIYK